AAELHAEPPARASCPESAQAGKGEAPVRWLLGHRAGLPYVNGDIELAECLAWDPVVEALAAMEPLWEPGTAHGYHAVTYGWLVGEVVRRISGRSLGRFFADEVAGPLGLEFWIGLPADQEPRVAPLTNRGLRRDESEGGQTEGLSDLVSQIEQFLGPGSMLALALGGGRTMPFIGNGVFNRPEVRAAEVPAANGVTNARSLARMYAAVVGPVEGVSDG